MSYKFNDNFSDVDFSAISYYLMDHRGGLTESLETVQKIDIDTYNRVKDNYEYYCFDERINCHRLILKVMPPVDHKPVWLLIGNLANRSASLD